MTSSVLLAALAVAAAPASAEIDVAASVRPLTFALAQADLTPPEPLPLGGYTERRGALAQPGGDRLMARALVLRAGPDWTVAVVAAEMLTIPEGFADAVRARLPAGVRLILTATHTHGAPDSQMLNPRMTLAIPGIASYRPRWREWYADRVADAVRAALARPGTPVDRLILRRRELSMNRSRRPGAVPDPEAAAFVARTPLGDAPLAHWYTAHPTLFDADRLAPTGDWPGAAMRRTPALVLNGPLGDVSPGGLHLSDDLTPAARAAELGRAVAAVAEGDASGDERGAAFYRAGDRVAFVRVTAPTPAPEPHPEFAPRNGIPEALARSVVARFAPERRTLTLLRLGRESLAFVSAEPSSAVGRSIAAAAGDAPGRRVRTVAHADGWAGYVLDADDRRAGGYEATLGFFGAGDAAAWAELARTASRASSQATPSAGPPK